MEFPEVKEKFLIFVIVCVLLAAGVLGIALFSDGASLSGGSTSTKSMETNAGNTNSSINVTVGGDMNGSLDASKNKQTTETTPATPRVDRDPDPRGMPPFN